MIVQPQVMQPQPSLFGSIGKTLLNIGTSFIPGNQFFKGLFGLGSNLAGNALFGSNSQALPITGFEYKQNAPQRDYTAPPSGVGIPTDPLGDSARKASIDNILANMEQNNVDPRFFHFLYYLGNGSDLYGGYSDIGNQIFGRRF